ncbi:MAG: protein-methionine-sulfoxide reductase catalytic subunit MsrP [Acidobacteriota bacterium]
MAYLKIPKGWEIPEREATSEAAFLNRRKFLAAMGIGAIGASGILPCPLAAADALYPAKRNPAYKLDRPITDEQFATRYNNFYEFTEQKEDVWKLVDDFKPEPWTIDVSGLVRKPQKLDLDQILRQIPLEERLYRHRCVEAWSMAVPWTGFPFKALIDLVEPKSEATYVRMVTFFRPSQAPGQRTLLHYPWPYYEGLTMAEAMNELAFLVTGMYGHAVPKQNGAPIRLAVPWKYGFKSIKSIVAIEFTSEKPPTFWNDAVPREYDFLANVNPKVPHPRWSQATERVIDTGKIRPTLMYNGYGSYVASLYEKT